MQPGSALERRDSREVLTPPEAILGFASVRNEILRLPYFLDYHRTLGIGRFFIVDNASDDGTREFLLSQEDVHVFFTQESYAASHCGVAWMNELLSTFGEGHWCLTLDADELLIYPESETRDLTVLTRYLDANGAGGLKTFLLDMYDDRPIAETDYSSGSPFLECCRYFDFDTYHEIDDDRIPVRGGPRHRLFWTGRPPRKPSPVLKKIPLVKWQDGFRYEASTHIIHGPAFCSLTGILLHFKLFSDFPMNALREAERMEHWDGAAQYRTYAEGLARSRRLCAHGPHSARYENTAQLVVLGLMHMPPDYAGWPGGNCPLRSP